MEIIFTLFVSLVEDNVTMIECFLHYNTVTFLYCTSSIARRANRPSTARKNRTVVPVLGTRHWNFKSPRLQVVQTTDYRIFIRVHATGTATGTGSHIALAHRFHATYVPHGTYVRRALSLIRLSYVPYVPYSTHGRKFEESSKSFVVCFRNKTERGRGLIQTHW